MMRLEVHKFGGTSVGDAARIVACARIVKEAAGRARVAVVASAMAGVTDELCAAAADAARGDAERARARLDALVLRHQKVLDGIEAAAGPLRQSEGREAAALLEVRQEIDRIGRELRDLCRSAVLLGEVTDRTRDRLLAAGEKLAVRLLAVALGRLGASARAMDADGFLDTDARFGEASPLPGVADRTIAAALQPILDRGEIPVVTGFCGRAPDGATTTLGRGGSDLSATVIAAALAADIVTIWTDVEGVYTADPRIVPEARVIPQLNFREAAELSYYGAKVLHQRTMIPVAARGIPVLTKSSMEPDAAGTVVDSRFTPGSHPVKAISSIGGHCLVSVEGKGMAGVPGVAARVFGSLARARISVTMISQSSSEASICMALPEGAAREAERALKRELAAELSRGDVEEIVVREEVTLVAAVGLGMAHTPGVAARVFASLARRGINVLAIAQGSSELNISLAVASVDAAHAVRAIHEEFGLHRLDTGEDTTRFMDLLLLGCGNIGRAMAGLVLERHGRFFERFGLTPRIVAVADRSGYLFRPAGIPEAELRAALDLKARERSIAGLSGARAAGSARDLVVEALGYRLARPVLVDVSDAEGTHEAYLYAMGQGCDVVSANKKPFAGALPEYRSLMVSAASHRRLLKCEATVGAGLPIVDTLEMLLLTGDRVTMVEGCLSGTLGFVMTRMEEGSSLPDAVREAMELGYTEPDPVADLSGADVARKALILGRHAGLAGASEAMRLEGLVDASLSGLPLPELWGRLEKIDGPLRARIESAARAGSRLRYVARVSAEAIEVGPVEVAASSPLGTLRGTDNMIVFHSERYRERPLVVSGPGAGVLVTAMGVLGDCLRIAAERR